MICCRDERRAILSRAKLRGKLHAKSVPLVGHDILFSERFITFACFCSEVGGVPSGSRDYAPHFRVTNKLSAFSSDFYSTLWLRC